MKKSKVLISNRVAIFSAILAVSLFLFLFLFLGYNQRRVAYNDSKSLAIELSKNIALETEAYLAPAFRSANSLAEKTLLIKRHGADRDEVLSLMKSAFTEDFNYLCVWLMCEPNMFDGRDDEFKNKYIYDEHGTMAVAYFIEQDSIYVEINDIGDFQEPFYLDAKNNKSAILIDPFFYKYHGYDIQYYETSVAVPIIDNGVHIGVMGIDIDLERLQKRLSKIKPYDDGFVTLYTDKGIIVSHRDTNLINKIFFDLVKTSTEKMELKADGSEYVETKSEFTGLDVFRIYHPIVYGKGLKPWTIMVEIPIDSVASRLDQLYIVGFLVLFVGFLLILLLGLNIRDRRRYELALNDSQQLFESLSQVSPIGIYRTDMLGSITYHNPMALTISGVPEEESYGFGWNKYIHPDDLNLLGQRLEMLINREIDSDVVEYRFVKADNSITHVLANVTVDKVDGEAIGVIGTITDISGIKEAQAKMAESEKRFRDLADMLPQTLWEANFERRFTYLNRKAMEVYGYSEDDIEKGLYVDDVIAPEEIERALQSVGEVVMNGGTSEGEYTAVRKDGSRFPVKIFGTAVIKSGIPVGFRGINFDLTLQQQAQRELFESEKRFRDLADMLPQPLWETNLTGQFSYINKKAMEVYGFTNNDIENGIKISDVLVLEDIDRAKLNLVNALENGASSGSEYIGVKKDGSKFPVKIFTSVVYVDGKPVGFRGVNFDMTEHYQAQRELRESEAKLRAIVEAFPDIIMLIDLRGNILFANDALEHITGITPADYSNPKRAAQIHPDDLLMVGSIINELIKSDKSRSAVVENRFIDTKGKVHWFSGTISKLILNDEVVLQIISKDVTEQHYIQRELDLYRFDLEIMVKERTNELELANEELSVQRQQLEYSYEELKMAQERLLQAEKMASLGVLSAGVAHEINNPLNYINGGALGIQTYIEEHYPDDLDNLMPLVEAINIGVDRAADIVRSLNRFSRQTDSLSERCDLHSVISGCLVILNNQLKNKIEVHKAFDDQHIILIGNEGRLHQAILNIITNSIHAIPNQGDITISTKQTEDKVVCTIVDNGEGISQEVMNKIFDPFFTTKAPGKGTGLGLSITYQIIEEMNGTIEYRSVPGVGTTVSMTFPLKNS